MRNITKVEGVFTPFVVKHAEYIPAGEYQLKIGRYDNGDMIMAVEDKHEGIMAVASVRMKEPLAFDEVAIKHWSENDGLFEDLVENGIVTKHDNYRTVSQGFVTIPIMEVNFSHEAWKPVVGWVATATRGFFK